MIRGNDAIRELERFNAFDRPIIGYDERYYDGRALVHVPYLKIGRNYLGSLFGLTWRQGLTEVLGVQKPPIDYIGEGGFWINLFCGGSIYLQDPRRLTDVAASEQQITLCILNKNDNNLYMTISAFFDNPSSGLIVDMAKRN